MRSGQEEDDEEEKRGREEGKKERRKGRRRSRASDIKSNNPHLAGGEQPISIEGLSLPHLGFMKQYCGRFQHATPGICKVSTTTNNPKPKTNACKL